MEVIKVRITGYMEAKEVNPIGDCPCDPPYHGYCEDSCQGDCWRNAEIDFTEWQEKEKSLRTFNIPAVLVNDNLTEVDEGNARDEDIFFEFFPIGKHVNAKIIDEKTIHIII